jgi:hypothetical protein
MNNNQDITNQVFGTLTALYHSHDTKVKNKGGFQYHQVWMFQCSCGTKKLIMKYSVVGHYTRSCGVAPCRKVNLDKMKSNRLTRHAWLTSITDLKPYTKSQQEVIKYSILGWTQTQIAEHLGIDQSCVCKYYQYIKKKYNKLNRKKLYEQSKQEASIPTPIPNGEGRLPTISNGARLLEVLQ